jgi:predicted dehydrogenase
MAERLRVGILGCGHLTQKGLLRHLVQDDFRQHAEVVALCDAVPERARAVAEPYGVAQAFGDLQAMLAGADLDAVLVITPVQQHYEHTMACLQAGKHVYVQKTMALTAAQAQEMVAAAAERGLTLAAAPGQMLCPAYQRMKRILQDDGIGSLMWGYAGATTGNAGETLGPDGMDSTWQYQYGGGALWNTSVYSLHALTGIVGPVRQVSATMSTPFPQRTRGGVPFPVTEVDNAALTLQFDGGALAICWGCRSATGKVLEWGAIGFYGTAGSIEATSIHMESGWPDVVEWRASGEARVFRYPAGGFAPGDGWESPLAPPPHAEILEQHVYLDLLDFVTAIREARRPLASAPHAAHVVEVIECAYRAAQTGQAQEIRSTFSLTKL